MVGPVGGDPLNPTDRGEQLKYLPETRQNTDDKDHRDSAIKVEVRLKNWAHAVKQKETTDPDKGTDDDHQPDLAQGLGEAGCCGAVRSARHGDLFAIL
jgi:hypothetical protein